VDDITIDVINAPIDLSGGQSYLEDFESGLGDWSVGNGSWQVGTPSVVGPANCNGGVQCAATVLDSNYPGNDSYFISPAIQLPTINLANQLLHLRFWHWFSIQASDNMRVEIRTEISPGVWDVWQVLDTYTGGSGGIWSQPLIDISAHSGQKIQLGFFMNYGSGTTAPGWYVDDVTISIFNF